MKTKREKIYSIMIIVISILLIAIIISRSYANLLENDVEVEPNSLLTYYLKVKYDGVDKEKVSSNDNTLSEVQSDTIYITDKIPEGLTFEGFETTENGTIGAVQRSDNETICPGSVVDDTQEESLTEGKWNNDHTEFTYHGLHYNKPTNTVTFKVKSLKAGCVLTVGIKTRTPETIDDPNTNVVETRRDFYNYANSKEDYLSNNSNLVHAYMGANTNTYVVNYEYTGQVPTTAPSPPPPAAYEKSATVGVAASPEIRGYTFSGWTSQDITIENGKFTMPEADITLKGSFNAATSYKVKYVINGTVPEDYMVQSEKSYYENDTVHVDSLKEGDTFNDYRFLGWTTSDVEIDSDNTFTMPNKNVTITGRFEQIKYTVTYSFYDTVLPPNSGSLLPNARDYAPGEIVNLATINNPSGYKFLGWYHDDNFIMPSENITIYGEWQVYNGRFSPKIEKTISIDKDSYIEGDVIPFRITITNNEDYQINDVIIKDYLKGFNKITQGDNIENLSDQIYKIKSIEPVNSVSLLGTYEVKSTDKGTMENKVEILGASTTNGYEFYKSSSTVATVQFNIKPRVKVCIANHNGDSNQSFAVTVKRITENSSNKFETGFSIKELECETLYLNPGEYEVKELVPQNYELVKISMIDVEIPNIEIDQINIQNEHNYEITIFNNYLYRGFYHSSYGVKNYIEGVEIA